MVETSQGPSRTCSQTQQFHSHGAGFRDMKFARVKGSSVLPPRFQRAAKVRQTAVGASLNKEDPDRSFREAVNVNPGWQRRPQEDI